MGSCSQIEGEGSPFGKDYLYEMQESVTIQMPWVSPQLLESVLLILKSRLLNPAEEEGAPFSYVCYSPVADLALSRPSPLLLSSQLFSLKMISIFFFKNAKNAFFHWKWFQFFSSKMQRMPFCKKFTLTSVLLLILISLRNKLCI